MEGLAQFEGGIINHPGVPGMYPGVAGIQGECAWYMITREENAPTRVLRSGRVVYTGVEEQDFQRFCRDPRLNRMRRGLKEGDVFYCSWWLMDDMEAIPVIADWYERFVTKVNWVPNLGQMNEDMVSTTGLGGWFSMFLFPGGQGPAEEFRPDLVGGMHVAHDWELWGLPGPVEWDDKMSDDE